MEPTLVVRFVQKASLVRAIIESAQGLHLSGQQTTRLSVEGATLGDAYENFKLALQGLQRARVVSPGIAITFRYVVHSASSAVPIARTQ
jgi:hypothetical protein